MRLPVIDVETTGMDPEVDRVVELAVVTLEGEGRNWRVAGAWSSLVDPGRPIPPEASAIHHLTDADVAGAPSLPEALSNSPAGEGELRAAHHAAFDSSFLPTIVGPWLCTWRSAMHAFPDAPSWKNQVLRYYIPGLAQELFEGGAEWTKRMGAAHGFKTHRALPDAWVTAHVLARMLREHGLDELRAMAGRPVLLRTVGFGKHRGMAWADVPPDYLRWAKGQDFDSDVKYTVEHWIGVHAERRTQLFSGPAKA